VESIKKKYLDVVKKRLIRLKKPGLFLLSEKMFQKPNGVDYLSHHKEKLKQRRKKALLYIGGIVVGSILLFHNDIPFLRNPEPYKAKPRYVTQQDSTYKDSIRNEKSYHMEIRESTNEHVSGKSIDSLFD